MPGPRFRHRRHARRGLLCHGTAIEGELCFTRTDTGVSVETTCHAEIVERPAELKATMQAALDPSADARARRAFAEVWQRWVRRILVEHRDDPALVTLA